jgi:hypothetical protein
VVTDRDRSVVAWIAVIGAVSRAGRHGEVRRRQNRGLSAASGARRPRPADARLVYGQPALYVPTRVGRAWAGIPQLDPAGVRVATTSTGRCARDSPSSSSTASAASGASRRYARPSSKPAVRSRARKLGTLRNGRPRLRRPDLVLFPTDAAPVTGRGPTCRSEAPGGWRDRPRVGAMPDRH